MIEEFCQEWGQSHEELCANLGYDEETADDLLMVDYFFYFNENCWLPISSSLYTAEEQELANELRLTADD
jgi:hypothetical protein